MERIAKLAIQRDLPDNFKRAFEKVYDAKFNSFWDEESPGSDFYEFYNFRFILKKLINEPKRKGYTKGAFESVIGSVGVDE